MSAYKYRQEVPPEGGYSKINWSRKIPKVGLSGYAIFGIFAGVTSVSWAYYIFDQKIKRMQFLEMNDARLATVPLYLAERQRMLAFFCVGSLPLQVAYKFLRQLRKNRDEENELMKNVPGWETGKWKGQPVYHDVNEKFPYVITEEFYAHCDPNVAEKRSFEHTTH